MFCRSASSWASLLFVISGPTLLSVVLAFYADPLAAFKTTRLRMLTMDYSSVSVLTFALANPFIPSIESSNICRSRNRSICVERVTQISARRKLFCRSASSWASLLFVISGPTLLSAVLAFYAAPFAAFKTSRLIMLTMDYILVSVFTFALANPFIPSIKSSNICRSRNRSICVERVCASVQ